jgi:adenylate kinase
VKEEFCKTNHLVPIKICINGPPLSGKTFFGEKLADHYRIPLINLKTLIPELEALEVKEGEKNEVITAMKEWKKANGKKRYPNELLYEMVRYRLQQNDCQNRGFVLDGFPRTYEDAKGLFYFTLK